MATASASGHPLRCPCSLRVVAQLALLGVAAAALPACGPPEDPGDSEHVGTAEEAICPAGETISGVDVSYYQGTIDWPTVAADGMEFAVARVSYGSGFVDPKFAKNWAGIEAAGLVRGTYQFFVPDQDPVAQANLLLAQLDAAGGLQPGDLPPVLDVEVTEGVSDANIISRMHTWLEHVEQGIGRKPMIYTSPGFWNGLGNPKGFSDYPLWVAHWGVACPTVPSGSWSDFVFWQEGPFTVSGISGKVDGDYFNGSVADLLGFAKGQPPIAQVNGNGAISVVSRTDGTADVFVEATGGDLLHASAPPGGDEPWSPFAPLVSGTTCGFAATSWPPTQKAAEAWAPLEDGATTQVWWSKTSGSWSKPNDFGGEGLGDLSSLAWRDGHVDVLALGDDGAIWRKTFLLGDAWSEWTSIGGDFVTGAAGILWGDGHGELFATDASGTAWHSGSEKTGWSDWAAFDGHAASRPVPVRWPDGHVEIFARGADDLLVHSAYDDAWAPLSTLDATTKLVGEPSAIMSASGPEVFARDLSGRVVRLGWDGTSYGKLAPHFEQNGASDPFAWVHPDGRAEVFVVSAEGALLHSLRGVEEDWSDWAPAGVTGVDPCAPPLPGAAGEGGGGGASAAGGGASASAPHASRDAGEDDAGCGCHTGSAPGGAGWAAGLAAAALSSRFRRRARGSRAPRRSGPSPDRTRHAVSR